ncbi:MAG: radical SAM protein, partial [Mucispirillum sp.]|nr:radical SAM protein [Mucispirillum sp.]
MPELKYIFGPVPSRRLGRSLGINIVPSKICSMDCIYCEVGRTEALTVKRKPYVKARNIIEEFEKNYDSLKEFCDVITITGAGEPALNSELDKIFGGIKEITDKPAAILTNAAALKDRDVYETLLKFDIVVPSLDAVSDDVFRKINLPHKDIRIADIIENLTSFSKEYSGLLYVEILFCKGVNDSREHIEKLASVLKRMNMTKVQAGTIHRPPAYSSAKSCDGEFLLETV